MDAGGARPKPPAARKQAGVRLRTLPPKKTHGQTKCQAIRANTAIRSGSRRRARARRCDHRSRSGRVSEQLLQMAEDRRNTSRAGGPRVAECPCEADAAARGGPCGPTGVLRGVSVLQTGLSRYPIFATPIFSI